jgi:phosphoribosylformylglycinamidine synthase
MNYTVAINVMPLKNLLDPQGKAVLGGLENLGLTQVMDVRIGKRIILEVEAADEDAAKKVAEKAATKLLANQVMEHFEISII